MNVSRQLNNYAKENGRDINKVRIEFALERLVARMEADDILSRSLVYKGGFVLLKAVNTNRYTVDIDALAHAITQKDAKTKIIAAIDQDFDDGIAFGDYRVSQIDVESEGYGGLRFILRFQLDVNVMQTEKRNRLPLIHIDIAFGNYLPGEPKKSSLPTILRGDKTEISWSIFPLEFIFAEKLQTLVSRGPENSRGKDIYDMSLLSEEGLNKEKLIDAISRVFDNRETSIPTGGFVEFMNRLDTEILRNSWKSVKLVDPVSFDEVYTRLKDFLARTNV